jgi:Fe-S-cluster containining protein
MSADACAGCTGRCCRDVVVPITGHDAWRIARANALAIDRFVTVASADADAPGAFRLGDGFGALVLAKNVYDARACVFLVTLPGGEGRCGTHPSRPRVCRTYPMARDGATLALRTDVVCTSGDWDMSRMSRDVWLAELAAQDADSSAYERIVAAWNATGANDFDGFVAFVGRAYDAIYGTQTDR